jgi:hypothetical protein
LAPLAPAGKMVGASMVSAFKAPGVTAAIKAPVAAFLMNDLLEFPFEFSTIFN